MADPQAFEELVTRYQGAVCAVAYAVLRDRARSEEVAQEAFLIAWQKLPAMTPPPVMPAWVCGIARNLAANARRRRKEIAMDHVTEPAAGTPLDHLLDVEREQLASRALAELDEADREAIVLYYRSDDSIAEVASTLGITEVAARKRLQRGRDRLRSALAAVETTLRSTRPTPAFTAACVAGLATLGADTASAATATARPVMPFVAGAAVIALAIGAGVMVARDSSTPSVPESSNVAAFASRGSQPRDATAIVKKIDDARRTALRDRIRGARIGQGAPQAPAIAGSEITKVYDFSGSAIDDATPIDPPVPASPLNKRGMRFAIRELQPMLHECYAVAKPRVGTGALAVTLTLVGEPDVGTIVDDVALDGDGARDKDFAECMRETLYAIELPPLPSAGETWTVHYPFVLR